MFREVFEALEAAVDNFESTELEPFREEVLLPKSKDPKKEFLSNFYHPNWTLIEKNIPELIASDIPNKPNVIFYDADHDHVNQLANLNSVLDFLAEDFILVLDDANFQGVVSSADEFVETNNLRPLFRMKILTSVVEDDKDMVIARPRLETLQRATKTKYIFI